MVLTVMKARERRLERQPAHKRQGLISLEIMIKKPFDDLNKRTVSSLSANQVSTFMQRLRHSNVGVSPARQMPVPDASHWAILRLQGS